MSISKISRSALAGLDVRIGSAAAPPIAEPMPAGV